jgi:hypothetical protein
LEEQEQDAAVAAAVGELGLGGDAIAASADDDAFTALDSGDDSLHVTALDALFSEGFDS